MLRKFLTYLAFTVLLIALPVAVVSPLRNLAVRAVSPMGRYLIDRNVAVRAFVHNISEISSLRRQRGDLQQELVQLQQQLIDEQETQRQNVSLRQELGVTGVTQTIPKAFGRVVTQGSDLFDRTFTLDVGEHEGVKVGQPVVFQGALVGRVITTRSDSCVVRSITSRESRIQVRLSVSREKGLLVGDGSSAYLSEITQGVKVDPKSVIETSGLGGSLPQGILVGQTGASVSQQSDQSQRFLADINLDPALLESAFVLLTDTQ
jgi:rod shape-determining protein MreC